MLTDSQIGTVAIANPEHAPSGRSVVAAMRTAGILEAVLGTLVLGENVAQAAEFVASGSADAGLVAISLVLAAPLAGQSRGVEVPLADFPHWARA
jgi:molybdate transport system substrate-binding protein